jgi:phosphopantetheinyl transferase (holo-ACP synthase)
MPGFAGIKLKDIEVKNNEQGKPILHLNAKAKNILDNYGITSVHLSLSHTNKQAGAVCHPGKPTFNLILSINNHEKPDHN